MSRRKTTYEFEYEYKKKPSRAKRGKARKRAKATGPSKDLPVVAGALYLKFPPLTEEQFAKKQLGNIQKRDYSKGPLSGVAVISREERQENTRRQWRENKQYRTLMETLGKRPEWTAIQVINSVNARLSDPNYDFLENLKGRNELVAKYIKTRDDIGLDIGGTNRMHNEELEDLWWKLKQW